MALTGAEQVQAALRTGADIIIAGRTTDTATIAVLPLTRGDHTGAAWGGAKIADYGALWSTNPTMGVIVVDFDATGCTVEAMHETALCTPHSVSAHMLYEKTDPFVLHEPGGHLDATGARCRALDGHRVKVEGAAWVPSLYTVKREGAKVAGYEATIMAMPRGRNYVSRAKAWVENLTTYLNAVIGTRMGTLAQDCPLEFRLIGVESALGGQENRDGDPLVVGFWASSPPAREVRQPR